MTALMVATPCAQCGLLLLASKYPVMCVLLLQPPDLLALLAAILPTNSIPYMLRLMDVV